MGRIGHVLVLAGDGVSEMTQDELKLAAEYHRGYEDGKAARDAQEWKLQQERDKLIRNLQRVKQRAKDYPEFYSDDDGWFDIYYVLGVEHRSDIPDLLIHLLGGEL